MKFDGRGLWCHSMHAPQSVCPKGQCRVDKWSKWSRSFGKKDGARPTVTLSKEDIVPHSNLLQSYCCSVKFSKCPFSCTENQTSKNTTEIQLQRFFFLLHFDPWSKSVTIHFYVQSPGTNHSRFILKVQVHAQAVKFSLFCLRLYALVLTEHHINCTWADKKYFGSTKISCWPWYWPWSQTELRTKTIVPCLQTEKPNKQFHGMPVECIRTFSSFNTASYSRSQVKFACSFAPERMAQVVKMWLWPCFWPKNAPKSMCVKIFLCVSMVFKLFCFLWPKQAQSPWVFVRGNKSSERLSFFLFFLLFRFFLSVS